MDITLGVIFNPASGPGDSVDRNYVDEMGNGPLPHVRSAGGIVYGYVPTTFATRDVNIVKADVDKYYDTLYPGLIDGIFFDEMSNDLADVGYYQETRDYVRGKSANAQVIGNPGTSSTRNPSGQMKFDVTDYVNSADTLVTFEDFGQVYQNDYAPPSWAADFTAEHFGHIVHTLLREDFNGNGDVDFPDFLQFSNAFGSMEPNDLAVFDLDGSDGVDFPDFLQFSNAFGMTIVNFVKLADERGAGILYFTNDALQPNPYDMLASYWTDQVNAVSAHNISLEPALTPNGSGVPEPAGLSLFGVGLMFAMALIRRQRPSVLSRINPTT